jgi:hypothetical protein
MVIWIIVMIYLNKYLLDYKYGEDINLLFIDFFLILVQFYFITNLEFEDLFNLSYLFCNFY